MSSTARALRGSRRRAVQRDPEPATEAARLSPRELFGTAIQGLRTRRLRAALSALGIAIGIGAMVAVVGVSSSSQANLLAEIDSLGTNLLTVTPGTTFFGANEVLPDTSVPMINHMQNVDSAVAVYQVGNANVLRHAVCAVRADGRDRRRRGRRRTCSEVVGTSLASGHFLNAVEPELPGGRARRAGGRDARISNQRGGSEVYIGNTWFTVVGIMKPVLLDPTLDSTVFISLPVAERLFQQQPNPSEIYVRANVNDVTAVSNLLAATADPQNADGVIVTGPSRRARGARRRQGPVHDAAARARCGGAARRRDRDREHHGDLGARAARRDRPAPRARRDAAAHHGAVPDRVRAARAARRDRRLAFGAVAT